MFLGGCNIWNELPSFIGEKKKKRRNQLNEGIFLKIFKFFLHWITGKKMGFVISAELPPSSQDKKLGSIYDVSDHIWHKQDQRGRLLGPI